MKGKRRWVLLMLAMAGLLAMTSSHAMLGAIPAAFQQVSPAFAAGGPLDTQFKITEQDNEREPRAAYDPLNDRYLVVARHYNGSGNDVLGQIVNADETVGAENWIANSSDNEVYPDVAYDPDDEEYLVVWVHWQTTGSSKKGNGKKGQKVSFVAQGQRVDTDGVEVGVPFDISPLYSDTVTYSRVAYNTLTKNYLVVWEVGERVGKGRHALKGSIYGATVDIVDIPGEGESEPRVGEIQTYAAGGYDTDCGGLDIAADNDHGQFLVIFPYCVNAAEVNGLLAAGDGTRLGDGPFEIASESGVNLDAQSVAYGGGQYLVVFVRPANSDNQFKARRVNYDGTPQGAPDGFVIFDPPVEDGVADGGMAVEFGAGSFLATWSYDPIIVDEIVPEFGYDRHIYGREVLPNETMPNAEFAISECDDPPEGAGCNQQAPGLAFNTTLGHFIVVWSNVPERYPGNIPANIWGRRWALGP